MSEPAPKPELTLESLDAMLKALAPAEPKVVKPRISRNAATPGASPRRDDWSGSPIHWELFEVRDFFEAQVCEECGRTNRVFGSRTLGYKALFGKSEPHKWIKLAPHEIHKLDLEKLAYSTETYDVKVPICHSCSRTVELAQFVSDMIQQPQQRELF